MSGSCSQCGTNGHDCSACSSSDSPKAIILLGVRVSVDPLRKTVSLNNVSQYQHVHEPSGAPNNLFHINGDNAGYASADDAAINHSSNGRERKRGVAWTEEEHKLFLLGLQKVGKGDWRGISRNYVKTRMPTQVASHAQKYFLRQTKLNRRRCRSSIFDITTDRVAIMPMEEHHVIHQDYTSQLHMMSMLETSNTTRGFPSVPQISMPIAPMLSRTNVIRPVPSNHKHPAPSVDKPTVDPCSLSLKLTMSTNQTHTSRHSAFQTMSNLNSRDEIIIIS